MQCNCNSIRKGSLVEMENAQACENCTILIHHLAEVHRCDSRLEILHSAKLCLQVVLGVLKESRMEFDLVDLPSFLAYIVMIKKKLSDMRYRRSDFSFCPGVDRKIWAYGTLPGRAALGFVLEPSPQERQDFG